MIADLPGSEKRVAVLVDAGLIVRSPRPERIRNYAIDTRDSVSPVFREVVIDAIDTWLASHDAPRLVAVANSGTLLAALWAGATGRPFWNALVKGARSRGFGRDLEPDVGIEGQRVALLDNHARSGDSLRTAEGIVARHGGIVVAAGVFTAGDHVEYSGVLDVFLPHREVIQRLDAASGNRQR